MTKTQRTDPHRPGAIIPANYDHWNSYSLPSGPFIPAIGVDCAMPIPQFDKNGRITGTITPVCADSGRCCAASTHRHARAEGREIFGNVGKCGVCGAHFVYGSMFRHTLTGAIVHMGHDCADKYEAMYDLSAWELENNRVRAAAAKHIAREANAKARRSYFDKHEGLEAALALGDGNSPNKGARILADLAQKLSQYKSLSDKQIAFALKLANEIRNPPAPKAEEKRTAAPTGKGVEFEGEIVSVKLHESQGFGYGRDVSYTWKCTIKVQTTDGMWLAWGTVASNIMELARGASNGDVSESAMRAQLVGLRVSVKSSLEVSGDKPCACVEFVNLDGSYEGHGVCSKCNNTRVRKGDPSFAFMSRPSMSVAGKYDHPVYKAPRKTKAERETAKAAKLAATKSLIACDKCGRYFDQRAEPTGCTPDRCTHENTSENAEM